MAFSQSDVDALKAALSTGALAVEYADGRKVTYRSLNEIERIIARAQDEVAASGSPRSRSFVAGF